MLNSLSIRNVVLIQELHLEFSKGLCVLTGETGAGKSILLDALGLALGERAETRLLRQGAKKADVTACFSLAQDHPLWRELTDQGISYEGSEVIFRRSLEEDGKSKCYLNDQVITQTLMRRLGQQLVEIHGQFDRLLDAKSHLTAIDAYGKIDKRPIQDAFKAYQMAKEALVFFQEKMAKAFERQTFLRFAVEDIEKAGPRQGEEEELESEKSFISHRAKIADALSVVDQNLGPVLTGLSQSHKAFNRIQDLLPEKINPLLEAADRALLESQEILEGMKALTREVEGTQHSLETIENRLYTLKSLCRKYQTPNLLACLSEFREELSTLEQGDTHIEDLERAVLASKEVYYTKAKALSEGRKKIALVLEKALLQELSPLKLDHAKIRVKFEELTEEAWGSSGIDRVEFYTQMNPGSPEGPLTTIASGGELSRLMLALKVVLTQSGLVPTLIFDEIESGTGGAVAAAMGERLKVLSQNIQLLAITHSPQIASHGTQHFSVFKIMQGGGTTTHVKVLGQEERWEEVARMLAGEEITEEARAAAKRLMG